MKKMGPFISNLFKAALHFKRIARMLAFGGPLMGIPTFAQQSILETYISEGLKNNLQLQREELTLEKSFASLTQAKALFYPQVSFSSSYTLAQGGRKMELPLGDLLNPVYSTLNQLTETNNFPTIQNQEVQFLPNQFHDTKLRVIQPLFNSDIYFGYKAQKELVTAQQAQKRAYENELRFSISSAYLSYLQSEEAISILTSTRSFLAELVALNQKLVANDKVTRDVLLNSQFEFSKIEQQLAEARKNNQTAKSYFNFLLNREWNTEILKDSLLITNDNNETQADTLASIAFQNRQELRQLQGAMRANNAMMDMANANRFLPKLSAVGDIGYQGFDYTFNNEQQYAMLQLSLSWDLFKGGERNAKTRQLKIEQQMLEKRFDQTQKQIQLEVIQANEEMKAASKAYAAAQSGVRSAEKAFQIISARYREGQALPLEFFDAQNKLTLSRLQLSVSRYEWMRKEASLKKAIALL
jgi:outer membrane protein TolC